MVVAVPWRFVELDQHEEDQLPDGVKCLIARYLKEFFAELAPRMPCLAEDLASYGLLDDPGARLTARRW
jgi:hypothetical protein